MGQIYTIVGNATYFFLALNALWGLFCVVMVYRRMGQLRFKNEDEQMTFLQEVESAVQRGDFETAASICDGDTRATSQLAWLAIVNRNLGIQKLKQLVAERFQRDILAGLEYRVGWVNSMIKTAPMLGLYGTVLGMMGAFGRLSDSGGKVAAADLAGDISLALLTTALGLTIAIPLLICVASINMRMRQFEDLVGGGVNQLFESLRIALHGRPQESRPALYPAREPVA